VTGTVVASLMFTGTPPAFAQSPDGKVVFPDRKVVSDEPLALAAMQNPEPAPDSGSLPSRPGHEGKPVGPPQGTPSTTSTGDSLAPRLRATRIVIDPGHGGRDPGASANGVTEAEIVLDVALRLEKLLSAQPGVEVVLTRRTNEFLPLEARTAIANRETADMFLSIHVNSSPHAERRGIETYLLDFASNADPETLAVRENATRAQRTTITLNPKLDESRELARTVQASLVGRLSPLSKGLEDLGVKRAPLEVLIGAEMPSALAEISFLTNSTDASLLKQADHRQHIAEALADAVLRYRTNASAP
jgi:N-acetylmuramoyl-L-alanine amidase